MSNLFFSHSFEKILEIVWSPENKLSSDGLDIHVFIPDKNNCGEPDVTQLEEVAFMDANKMIGLKPGINFNNIIRAAFTHADPKSIHKKILTT